MGELVETGNRRSRWRLVSLLLWAGVLAYQGWRTTGDPSLANTAVLAGFGLLFAAVNAQILLLRWMGHRRLRQAMARLNGAAYISELDRLPNRNYLLSELRREMPRARASGTPFVLVVLGLDTIDDVRARRGAEFAGRATRGLAGLVTRLTRSSDFAAHLGGARFCVLLNDCSYENSFIYLQRVPGSVPVSDGHRTYEVPLTARIYQYDLESLYATDVLRDAEEAKALKRKESEPRFGVEAA